MTQSDSTHPQANPVVLSDEAGELLRPARVLLGWLPDDQAFRLLASGRADVPPTDEHRNLVALARTSVNERTSPLDQSGLVSPLPAELNNYEADLRVGASAMFAEGWELRLVDLSRVCAFQPVVFTDHAMERTSGATAEDLISLAELTVPSASTTPLRASFDENRNAWVVVSANPNLRLVAPFSAPVLTPAGTVQGFGFALSVLASRLQVAQFQGRYFLRDGYHRSIGLLASGIHQVPAFVRTIGAIEELGVQAGMLPQGAYMGANPPTLMDYLEQDVAADVRLPASQKMVMVQGLEIGFLA